MAGVVTEIECIEPFWPIQNSEQEVHPVLQEGVSLATQGKSVDESFTSRLRW